MSPAVATKPVVVQQGAKEAIAAPPVSLNHGPILIGANRAEAINDVEAAIRCVLSWKGKCPWAPGRALARLDMAQDIEALRRRHGDMAVNELQARFKQKPDGADPGEALRAPRAQN